MLWLAYYTLNYASIINAGLENGKKNLMSGAEAIITATDRTLDVQTRHLTSQITRQAIPNHLILFVQNYYCAKILLSIH